MHIVVCKSRIRGARKKQLHLSGFVEGLLGIVDLKVTTDGVRTSSGSESWRVSSKF